MRRIVVCFAACLMLWVLAACTQGDGLPTLQPGEVDVPFQNLALDEWNLSPAAYLTAPQVFALTDASDIARVESFIAPDALHALQQADFATQSVIAVLRGQKGCSLNGVGVEWLGRRDNIVTIYAQFWQPASGYPCQAAGTWPYHLIQVPKRDIDLQDVQLVLQPRAVDKKHSTDGVQLGDVHVQP